jgi:hypothetical protein
MKNFVGNELTTEKEQFHETNAPFVVLDYNKIIQKAKRAMVPKNKCDERTWREWV